MRPAGVGGRRCGRAGRRRLPGVMAVARREGGRVVFAHDEGGEGGSGRAQPRREHGHAAGLAAAPATAAGTGGGPGHAGAGRVGGDRDGSAAAHPLRRRSCRAHHRLARPVASAVRSDRAQGDAARAGRRRRGRRLVLPRADDRRPGRGIEAVRAAVGDRPVGRGVLGRGRSVRRHEGRRSGRRRRRPGCSSGHRSLEGCARVAAGLGRESLLAARL
mmetsp:Transcript_18928/g.72206  ORF Transcript_18928/g.72206 Transcript_18928/m.72206 type:complete len:217 (+) Transcript_18928:1524-2174(+)